MLRCLIVFLLAFSLSAQVTQKPKYKVVKADKPEPTVAALNTLAEQGYRLILPGPVFILRLEATPPDTYRYMAVGAKGGPVQFVNWLNEQGTRGYRWVWPGAEVMEKEPHPRNYEYTSPGAHLYHFGRAKTDVISSLMNQGYQPMGFARFFHIRGSSTREMFFEREMGTESRPGSAIDAKEIEIADAMRADNVVKKVDALAKSGYRYLGPCPSPKGGLAVMMRKCGQDCDSPFEYRSFDVHDSAQLDRDLNEQGKAGFRVVPQVLMMRLRMMERGPAKAKTYAYHVLQYKDPAALEQELNGKEQEGYEPIGYVGHSGFWTAETLLLLEKTAMVSATPQGSPPQAQPPSK